MSRAFSAQNSATSPDSTEIASGPAAASLPDAPEPEGQTPSTSPTPKANPCPGPNDPHQNHALDPHAAIPGSAGVGVHPAVVPCQTKPLTSYQRFMNGPRDKVLTPRDKAWLAARGVADPFNIITIAGEAAIAVGFDAHSAYGPGMAGYGRYVGVSFTQDMTGEFIGTFLIPTIAHQDPRYHRMEGHRIPRRVAHAITQIFWTGSDTGKGMPNYANLVGFAIEDEISNLYVPGRETDAGATAQRYAIGLGTAPIGNIINEFLPDLASHVHIQIVILQRIINQVARSEAGPTNSDGLF